MAEAKTIKKIKVRVLVNLKYDKEAKKIGQELEVRPEDLEDMTQRKLIEVIE